MEDYDADEQSRMVGYITYHEALGDHLRLNITFMIDDMFKTVE